MDSFIELFKDVGAFQCWHKHSTFGEHLMGVWRIFQCWQLSQDLCRMALFHSTYSNSWVSLTLFRPGADRGRLRAFIGTNAEELVHLMCSVPRMELTFQEIFTKGVPVEGITVKDIRTGEPLVLTRRQVAIYTIFHIADWLDQNYGWQDDLFRNYNGIFEKPFLEILAGTFHENPGPLWPGEAKPGLYLSHLSILGKILRSCDQKDLIAPVFDNCTTVLPPENEVKARDLYWEVVNNHGPVEQAATAQDKLERVIKLNPFLGEPHAILAQIHIRRKHFKKAEEEALIALKLFNEFGTCWDKRLKWEAWVNWCRTVLIGARNEKWPETSMGMIGLGLVWDNTV